MMLRTFVFAAAVAIVAAGCGESQNVEDGTTSTIGSQAQAAAAGDDALGTAGANAQSTRGEEATRDVDAELPDTASPLATIGIAGLVALVAAGGLRMLGGR